MFALLSPRLWILVGVAVFLAGTHWKAYVAGKTAVRLEWQAAAAKATADQLEAERLARARELELNQRTRRIANDLVAEKSRRAAADLAAADSLHKLRAALAEPASPAASDPAAPARADDDPRDGIIAECAGAVLALDKTARSLAGTLAALQGYTSAVCVSKP